MKYSLLIQGPLNEISIDAIDKFNYQEQFDEIIISHWSCDNNKEQLIKLCDIKNIIIVETELPQIPETCGPDIESTFWYQITSTYEGLKKCQGEFTVKMRSDEYFEDFTPLKELIKKTPHKMIFGNIFAKCFSHSPLHIGDHVFSSNTNTLQETFKWISDVYQNHKKEDMLWWTNHNMGGFTPESIIARSFLYNNEKLKSTHLFTSPFKSLIHEREHYCSGQASTSEWETSTEYMKFFECFNIIKLKKYSVRWVHGHQTWNNETNPIVWDINCVEDMIK